MWSGTVARACGRTACTSDSCVALAAPCLAAASVPHGEGEGGTVAHCCCCCGGGGGGGSGRGGRDRRLAAGGPYLGRAP
jgi:hypothetical protein